MPTQKKIEHNSKPKMCRSNPKKSCNCGRKN